MADKRWRLLTTLSDAPSAEALARVLGAEGLAVRVVSEAHLIGQAAHSRIFVDSAQLYQARWTLSQRQFSEEELARIATSTPLEVDPRR